MNYSRMKHLLTAFFLFTGISVFSQISCTVTPSDTIVCYGDSVAFVTQVTGEGPFTYSWYRNGALIDEAYDSIFAVAEVDQADTGVYLCIVTNIDDTATSNEGRLRMHPKMNIDTLYRTNSQKCFIDTCQGQFKFKVSGGTLPYRYDWGGGQVLCTPKYPGDGQVDNLQRGSHVFTVTDKNKCSISKPYSVDFKIVPIIEFTVDPGDTIYLTKPLVTVTFPDSVEYKLDNWTWYFGDSISTVPIVEKNPGNYILPDTTKIGSYRIQLYYKYYDDGCDTIVTHEVTVKRAKLKIPNVFTPDNNGINDNFEIKLEDSDLAFSDVYMSTDLVILDRWGRHIYSKTNYTSGEWDGKNQSDGQYFYVLTCKGFYGTEVYKGAVTILRDK